MTFSSKSYISYGVKALCVVKWCCVYFLNNRSVVGASISSTQKVLKVLLLSAPKKYCSGKMRIHYFSGQEMIIASDSDNNVSLRHSPRHFPERNLVMSIIAGRAKRF